MIYLRLYWEFFKTGLFSVGGGLATLPFLSRMADATGWFTQSQLADMVAVSESTPGSLGVNMATYVGFTTTGVLGGVIATLGLITPPIVIILLIAALLHRNRDNPMVTAVFACLRPASVGLILAAGLSLAAVVFLKPGAHALFGQLDGKAVLLALALLLATHTGKRLKRWHPLVWIGLSAAAGIAFFSV